MKEMIPFWVRGGMDWEVVPAAEAGEMVCCWVWLERFWGMDRLNMGAVGCSSGFRRLRFRAMVFRSGCWDVDAVMLV